MECLSVRVWEGVLGSMNVLWPWISFYCGHISVLILNPTTIIVHAHLPSFSHYDIFHFPSSKSFQTGCHCLASLFLSVVSSPKQAVIVFTPALFIPANILPSSKRSKISWFDPSLLLVYFYSCLPFLITHPFYPYLIPEHSCFTCP